MPDHIEVPARPSSLLDVPPRRFWGERKPPKNREDMFSSTVRAATGVEGASSSGASAAQGTTATLRMYGPIDSWGGMWGISARDVAAALDSLGSEVDEIRVRINSPGGEAWEGMAILNLLRAHPAKVVAVVDGLAASAASYIAAGVDETVMSPGTQLMIHDASAFAFGPAAIMRKAAEFLDSLSNSIASLYAEAAGGTDAEWRDLMVDETWYTAQEAVEAGLADRVAVVPDAGRTTTSGTDPVEPSADPDVEDLFDLSIFNYAGRSHAPAPKPPAASAAGSATTTEGGSAVAFSDEQITTLRQKLGVAEDADEATILAALDESLAERAEPLSTPPAAPAATTSTTTPAATAAGTMVIDSSAWDAAQERIKRLERVDAKRRVEERDQVITQAVHDGKFPQARVEHWKRLWDNDPEGTRTVIDGLTKNVIPVNELGHGGAGDDGDFDDEFAHLFPKGA